MPVETARAALNDAVNEKASGTLGLANKHGNILRWTAELQAEVQLETAQAHRQSMTALETAMNVFTAASNKGSEALTKATNKLVLATWVLAAVAAVQALVVWFGRPG